MSTDFTANIIFKIDHTTITHIDNKVY